jgi:hypothetical protein
LADIVDPRAVFAQKAFKYNLFYSLVDRSNLKASGLFSSAVMLVFEERTPN